MSDETKRLFDESLRLSNSERAELALRLLKTLDGDVDDSAERAWEEEIARRAEAARNGSQPALSREEYDALVRRHRG